MLILNAIISILIAFVVFCVSVYFLAKIFFTKEKINEYSSPIYRIKENHLSAKQQSYEQ